MATRYSFLLIAMLALAGCGTPDVQAQTAPPLPEVSVAPVLARSLPSFAEFTGRLEAVESVEIRPRVSGYVDAVRFTEGAHVTKGQLLYEIDPRPLRAEVDRLSAELERARAQVELSRSNHERGKRLREDHVIAEQALEQLNAEALQASGALGAARAALEAARLNLEFTRVRSPIDGRASRALVRPGNLVTSESLLTTVVSTDPIHASFDADERTFLGFSRALAENSAQARGVQVFMGLGNEGGFPHAGTLDFLDNRVDPRTGTIRARGTFTNSAGAFTPGLFVRIKLAISEEAPRILVEERAIGTDLGKRFVLVLKPDQTVEYRRVELGASVDGLRVVDQGLNAKDLVVVNGLSRVRPGMKVSAKQETR